MTRQALRQEVKRVTDGRLVQLSREEIEQATGRNAETIRRDEGRKLITRSGKRPRYDYAEVEAYFIRLGELTI